MTYLIKTYADPDSFRYTRLLSKAKQVTYKDGSEMVGEDKEGSEILNQIILATQEMEEGNKSKIMQVRKSRYGVTGNLLTSIFTSP